jgi:ABC-type lipoprotein release transport system permease subunit
MMRASALWARREIWRDWAALLLVALVITVAGGAVMAGVAGARRAGASVDRFLAGSSAVRIFTQEGPIGSELRGTLTSDPRVVELLDFRIVLATPADAPDLSGATLVLPEEYWVGPGRPRFVEGASPVGPDEIAVSEGATNLGLSVGDSIAMQVIAGDRLDACLNEGVCVHDDAGTVIITGVVRLSDDLEPTPFDGAVFLAPSEFAEIRGGDDITTGYITDVFARPGSDPDELVADYSTRVERGDVRATNDDLAGVRRAAELQHDGLLIASAILAVAGVLIVGQTLSRFLARRAADAERLAVLGMTRGQRAGAGWLPGITGAALGAVGTVPLTIALSPVFPRGTARRADPDVGVRADWAVITVGAAATFAIGACLAGGAALIWCRTSARGESTATVSLASRLVQGLRLGPNAAMGSRFALEPGRGSHRTPVAAALGTSVAAVAVVVGAVVVADSLDGLLASGERYGVGWDLQVSAGDRTIEAGEQVAADARTDAVALAVSGELNLAAEGSPPAQVFAVGMSSIKGSVEPIILEGRGPIGADEVVLGSNTLESLGVGIGDAIDVSGPLGEQSMVIVGRTIVPLLGSDSPDVGVVVPLQSMLDLGGLETVGEIDVQPAVFVSLADGVDIEAAGRDIEMTGAARDGPFRPSSVSVLDELRTIPIYIAVFVATMGALAMLLALVVTSRRRRGDLAAFRALGALPRDAAAAVCWQGLVASLAAVAVGVPAGVVVGRRLWISIAERNNVLAVVEIPWWTVGLTVAAAVVGASAVLAAWPAWTVSRRRPGEDLRAE